MQRLRVLADHFPFAILYTDASGAATYANAAWSRISGLSAKDSQGSGWLDVVHARDHARVRAAWMQATADHSAIDLSYRIVRPDARRRFIRLSAQPLPSPTDGVSGWVAIVQDITDQVMAERRVRRNNLLLTAVLENIPCGVTVFDADGSLLLDNQRVRSLLSLPEEMGDRAITDFGTLAVDGLPRAKAVYLDTASESHAPADADAEPRLREEAQPDGRVLEVRDAPMPTGGIVTTYTDITQHKQVIESLRHAKAAAEQAAAAKAAFLAIMSHEIRTPMNGVLGMTDVLLASRLTPDQRELLEVIRQSGESLLVVLNDILDYSKIESGQMQLEWKPFRLKDVIDNCARLLEARAEEKRVRLLHRVDYGVPSLIHGDSARLQQVLVNLISNAVKFTQHGQVRLSVSDGGTDAASHAAQATGDLCTIVVTVQDTGIGIPKEQLSRIFEPFVQADSSTARRFGGTGLGLAIARRLVEAMGGAIEIDSEAGVGTTVRFSFLAEIAAPRTDLDDAETPLWSTRALLVFSEAHEPGMLGRQLKRWGVAYDSCASAAEALGLVERGQRFDFVICGTRLTDTSGVEFARKLRAQGVDAAVVLISHSRLSEAADPKLVVAVLPRSPSESVLYQALVEAMRGKTEGSALADARATQFDPTLASRIPLRILVAEDNEINRKVALRTLREFGYEADVVQNGMQAIKAVRAKPYDMVLMDMRMPEMDGVAATRFIVGNLPPARRPRIVAMSANVMREDVEAALAAGADDYLDKPFSPSDLRKVLEQSASGKPEQHTTPHRPLRLLVQERLCDHLDVDGTGEFLQEMAASFASRSNELVGKLRACLTPGDLGGVREAAHELAGMGAVLGAERLVQICIDLENGAKRGDLKGGSVLVDQCTLVQGETISALESFLRMRRGSSGDSMAKGPAPGAYAAPRRGRK